MKGLPQTKVKTPLSLTPLHHVFGVGEGLDPWVVPPNRLGCGLSSQGLTVCPRFDFKRPHWRHSGRTSVRRPRHCLKAGPLDSLWSGLFSLQVLRPFSHSTLNVVRSAEVDVP